MRQRSAGCIHQNTVCRKTYGAAHKEEGGNRSFAALIESYKKNGYNPSSIVTVDSDLTLMECNHRMGLNLYEKIESGNTFCAVVRNVNASCFDIKAVMPSLCKVLKVIELNGVSSAVQYARTSLYRPQRSAMQSASM